MPEKAVLTLIALLSGLIGGIIGLLLVFSVGWNYPPAWVTNRILAINQGQPVVVRQQQQVTVLADEFLNENALRLRPSLAVLLKAKDPGSSLTASVYGQEDVAGYGAVVTSDGWLVFSAGIFAGTEMADWLVLLSSNKLLPLQRLELENVSQTAFVKVTAEDLQAVPLAGDSRLDIGSRLLAAYSQLPSNQLLSKYLNVDSYAESPLIESTEEFSSHLLLDPDLGVNLPVFNQAGELVGLGQTGQVADKLRVMPVYYFGPALISLLRNNSIDRPYFGIEWINLKGNIGLSEQIRQGRQKGAYVYSLRPNGPGELAGLKLGDIITHINSQEINGELTLTEFVQQYLPASIIYLSVMRQGQEMELEVELGRIDGENF